MRGQGFGARSGARVRGVGAVLGMAGLAAGALVFATASFAVAPAASAASAPPGLSSATVTVGNVASLSGPIPGAFSGALYGVQAYFAYVNSHGGVNGRRLLVDSADDTFTCQGSTTATQSLVGHVFAFVGDFSLYDGCQAQVLSHHKATPDVSYALSPEAKSLPSLYSPQPSPPGSQTGPFKYLITTHPKDTKVGALATSTGSSAYSMRQQLAAMKSVGYKVLYTNALPLTQSNYTPDILRMRNAGVNVVNITDLTFPGSFLSEAQLQGWHPLVIDPTLYSYSELAVAGPGANGAYMPLLEAMFLGQDRAHNPAVGTFLTWLGKTHPGFKADLFTFYGWISAELFADALKSAGKNPTQAGVLNALKANHSYTASGLVPSTDVGKKKPPVCYLIAQVQGTTWKRLYPHTDFSCKYAGYHYYHGS